MLRIEQRTRVLHELATQAVPETVDLWPTLKARGLREKRHRDRAPIWRWAGLATAAGVLVALIGLGVVPSVSTPEAVSAETILDRAELAGSSSSGAVSTYHLVMTGVGKDGRSTSSEVWFEGADRQRTIQQVNDPNGAGVSRQDVIFNGQEAWIEDTQNGSTRVIHTTGTTWTRPADSPAANANLSELLKSFGDKTCMAARLEQTAASVAGQATYVLVTTPRIDGCRPGPGMVEPSPGPAGGPPRIRVNGQTLGSNLGTPPQLTIWVDKVSFLPLRIEVRDGRGVMVDRSEVTSVEYNVSIPSSIFAYVPPAGVPVATFTGGDGADVKRALAADAQPRTPPAKSP